MIINSDSIAANQFENWSITHFDTLVEMHEVFQRDCAMDPDADKGLTFFIEYMYENAQDVVATWHNPTTNN
jgi:hypothetical protein